MHAKATSTFYGCGSIGLQNTENKLLFENYSSSTWNSVIEDTF